MENHVCPWWLAYTFDNPLRRIFHNPKKIFSSYLNEGMTAADLGCGMGYFSIGMAHTVGKSGKIISVDIQQEMLDTLLKRAEKKTSPTASQQSCVIKKDIGVNEKVDFVLTFWMVHETPDQFNFLNQVHSILKKSGKLLLAEPKIHVTDTEFKETLDIARKAGFKLIDSPKIYFSRTALFEKQ